MGVSRSSERYQGSSFTRNYEEISLCKRTEASPPQQQSKYPGDYLGEHHALYNYGLGVFAQQKKNTQPTPRLAQRTTDSSAKKQFTPLRLDSATHPPNPPPATVQDHALRRLVRH